MANEVNNIRRHLTEEDFRKWDSGEISPDEMEFFLSHTASCDTCADNWMIYMAQAELETLPEPPAYLEEEILLRSKQPDLLIAQKMNRTSRQIQLLTYSLKVCTAVVLSIVMLFSINLTNLKIASVTEPSPITQTHLLAAHQEKERENAVEGKEHYNIMEYMRDGAQNVTESLQNFTKTIFSFEFNFSFDKED